MTRIEKLLSPLQPGKPWTAVLEGGETLRLPEGAVADFALYGGMELTEETMTDLRERAFRYALREKAVAMLSRQMLSAGLLREKLIAKGAAEAQAEEVVRWASEIGLLNDRAYAAALVRLCQSRGYGVYRIRDELYRRRVPREYWEEALSELEDPAEAIDRYLEQKLTDPSDRRQVKRASDALARRGFSWNEVSEGIRRARDRTGEELW
jgi:regulatory protein